MCMCAHLFPWVWGGVCAGGDQRLAQCLPQLLYTIFETWCLTEPAANQTARLAGRWLQRISLFSPPCPHMSLLTFFFFVNMGTIPIFYMNSSLHVVWQHWAISPALLFWRGGMRCNGHKVFLCSPRL